MSKNITKIALKGIALAMGIAVIVLGILKTLDINAGVSMLGSGLTALALAGTVSLAADSTSINVGTVVPQRSPWVDSLNAMAQAWKKATAERVVLRAAHVDRETEAPQLSGVRRFTRRSRLRRSRTAPREQHGRREDRPRCDGEARGGLPLHGSEPSGRRLRTRSGSKPRVTRTIICAVAKMVR